MAFRFYTRQISEATRGLAAVVFVVGMLLIGGAMLIYSLPKLFAYLAAGVFFFVGISVLGYSLRLFIAASRMDRQSGTVDFEPQGDEPVVYRKQVDAHVEQTKPSDSQ